MIAFTNTGGEEVDLSGFAGTDNFLTSRRTVRMGDRMGQTKLLEISIQLGGTL